MTATAESARRLPPARDSMPPFTVTPPVKVLAPVRVWVPVPAFTSAPAPEITPPNVPLSGPSRVSVFAFNKTLPVPTRVLRVWLPALLRFSVAAACTFTAPVGRLPLAPTASVPAEMVVPPV
ncbi:hypothetical protein D3C85_1134890 [compost metagenome]